MSNETVETTPRLFVLWPGLGCEILGQQQSVCISPQLENTSHTASAPLLDHWGPEEHLSLDKSSPVCQVFGLGLSLEHLNRSKAYLKSLAKLSPLLGDIKLIEVGCSSFRLCLILLFHLIFPFCVPFPECYYFIIILIEWQV